MKLVLIALLPILMTGCASILNESHQRINISTSDGSKVKGNIDGINFTSPALVSVKRAKADRIINIDSEKCTPQTVVASSVDNVFFINILSGGTFGSSTDFGTEKMWKYQDSIVIQCAK